MRNQVTTQENINKLIEFRQAVYAHVFQARRDALFEMLDALLIGETFPSFAYLSQSKRFRHRWYSVYQAVEDGRIDSDTPVCALWWLPGSASPRRVHVPAG